MTSSVVFFSYGRPVDCTDEYDGDENGFDPEIVFVYRIDHDFCHFTDEDMDYMNTTQERLFTLPFGNVVGKYLILNLARGLAGDQMKRIMFLYTLSTVHSRHV